MEPRAITEALQETNRLVAFLLAAVPLVLLTLAPEAACPATAAVTGAILLASGLSFRRAALQSASR